MADKCTDEIMESELWEALNRAAEESSMLTDLIKTVRTFEDAGIRTPQNIRGLVITMEDGTEFRLTITQTWAPART